ncbi:restriction endonuclease subunit S [Aureimonas sp. AU22]|uniref:restriction endonuclease subunit S n=1 Tax=Aureimonas sp. AU22 TaxID=1638162 RepID=UPI0007822C03|nr:restriction endonuclease subunit S [Aureimonas sp. AU22]
MTTALNPYPEYRDSGVDWLPKVPAHWGFVRNGRLFAERNETGFPDLPILEVSLRTGVRVRDMDGGRKQQLADRAKYKRATEGDIAYNIMRMWQGAVGIAPCDGLISPAYVVARPLDDIDPRFYTYLFRTTAYMRQVDFASRGIVPDRNRLYWQYFKPLLSPAPPPTEQRRIADFLDAYTAQVHRLIAAKRRIRSLLVERRQAITRGLVFCGIDEQSALVDSGVDWVGLAPEAWTRVHLGSAANIIPGYPFDARLFGSEDGAPLIRIRDLLRGHTFLRVGGQVPDGAWVRDGDLLVGMDGDFNSVIWGGGEAALNQRLCCLRPGSRLTTSYLALVLPFALRYINDLTFSTTVKHLSTSDLRRLRFPVPEVEEQAAIVAAVDERTKDLNFALSRVETEIDLILEYRDSLTAAVVTGRLDVRDATIPTVEGDDFADDMATDDEDMEYALDAVD